MTAPTWGEVWEAADVLGGRRIGEDPWAFLEARGVPTLDLQEMRDTVDLLISAHFVFFLRSEPGGGRGLRAEPLVIARSLSIFQSLIEDGLEEDPRKEGG